MYFSQAGRFATLCHTLFNTGDEGACDWTMTSRMNRAAVACGYCRRRKRRCDGEVPQCRTCRIKGIECEYSEPGSRREYEDNNTIQRFEAIENALREHADALRSLRRPTIPPAAPPVLAPSASVESSPVRSQTNEPATGVDDKAQTGQSYDQSPLSPSTSVYDRIQHRLSSTTENTDDTPAITIPLGHQTSTSNVLILPQCRQLVGDYPEEFFFLIESRRLRGPAEQPYVSLSPEDSEQIDGLDRVACDQYLRNYLARVYPFHPFLDSEQVGRIYEKTMERGIRSDHDSALVLVTLALGAIALEPIQKKAEDTPGEALFQRSLSILLSSWTFNFSGDVRIPQALVLCAVYYTYKAEPLMAWRLIYMASTSIQELLSRYKDMSPNQPQMQTLTRLSWVCFNLESDILAEFHQPRSGIELLVDKMPFPNYGENATPANLYALAEISVRTLLNRIHHSLFFTDSLRIYRGTSGRGSLAHDSPFLLPEASHIRVCDELSRQLETWYDRLPEEVKPELTGRVKGNRQACLLRLRYWSSRQNIYRAFLIYVTSRSWHEHESVPQVAYDPCATCIHACRMYVVNAGHLIYERTPYAYSCAMACVTSALLLTIAAQTLPLKHLVEDIESIQQMVCDYLLPWAQPRTSIKSGYEIACLIATKQHFNEQRNVSE